MFGLQAVDLRTYIIASHFDASSTLSGATRLLYETVRSVVRKPPCRERPYVWDDNEQSLDAHIELIAHDIEIGGLVRGAVRQIWEEIGKPMPDQ